MRYKYRDPERNKTTTATHVVYRHDNHIGLWMKYIDQLYYKHPNQWTLAEQLIVHHYRTWIIRQTIEMRKESQCNGSQR